MNHTLEEGLDQDYFPRQRRAQEDQVRNLRLAQMRARELKSFEIPGRPGWFYVLGGGGDGHQVHVEHGEVIFCDCKSFEWRSTCKHAERVNIRLGFLGAK